MDSPRLYLQLWSLRHETAADPVGALQIVRPLGFDGVELAGDYGWNAEQWRTLLDETGLEAISAHVQLATLEEKFVATVAFHRAIGVSRLVVSSLPKELQGTDGYHEAARRLTAVGKTLAGEGLKLGYHNHDSEFFPLESANGQCGMDILLAETDPAAVRFEFDTFWLEFARRDAVEFIREHAARVCLIHAKDLRKSDRADVAAGLGNVDFQGLVPICKENGWPVIVEYEGEDAPEVVREGATFLRALLG